MTEEQGTELSIRREESFSLARLMPQNVKELAWFAQQVVASGMFKVGGRNMTTSEAFLMMSQGVELGLSPIQSLRELNIINGRVDVPASVRAARIAASPKVTQWEVASSKTQCTIAAKRKDRTNGITVTVNIADISKADLSKQNWQNYPAEMLYARAVRRISRLYFADLNLGIGNEEADEPREIIDVNVAAIEREAGPEAVGTCETCGKPTYLHPNRQGGVYSECAEGHRQSPPQAVRDTVRGRMGEFTVDADADTPAPLEPGERLPEPGEMDEFTEPENVEAAIEADTVAPATEAEMMDAKFPVEPSAPERDHDADWESFEKQYQQRQRDAVAEFVKTKGPAMSTAEKKAILEACGWSKEKGRVGEWLNTVDSKVLQELMDGFHLKVQREATV